MTINVYCDLKITRRIKHHQVFDGDRHVATFQNFQDVLDWLCNNGHERANIWGAAYVYTIKVEASDDVTNYPPWVGGRAPGDAQADG